VSSLGAITKGNREGVLGAEELGTHDVESELGLKAANSTLSLLSALSALSDERTISTSTTAARKLNEIAQGEGVKAVKTFLNRRL